MANSYLSKTPSSAGNRRTFTFSTWLKRGSNFGSEMGIFTGGDDANATGFFTFYITTNDRIDAHFWNGSSFDSVTPNTVLRDPAAWYHLVCAVDTTQSTASDRIKIYINGELQTSMYSTDYPDLNHEFNVNHTSIMQVGVRRNGSGALAGYFDGYMSHAVLVDGAALTAASFGETDSTSGIWKFKNPSGITFGTNGFHLKFENSAALGTDSSGNSNTYTVNGNLVQSVDTPSNVFCTMNPIVSNRSGFTFSNGNLTVNTPSTSGSAANMGVNQGKWYFECLINTLGNFYGGWQDLDNQASNTNSYMVDGCVATNNGPDIYYGTSSSSANSMNGMAQGDYIGFAIDVPNLKCWWSRNGQWYTADSATPTTLTRAQVSANNNGFDLTTGSEMNSTSTIAPYMGTSTAATNNSFNFGAGIFGTTKLTGTTYTDDNGVGIFKYEPPAGFRAICTKNINTYG